MNFLRETYTREDSAHGIDHVIETEKMASNIARQSRWAHSEFGLLALRAAALLHDVGYTQADATWSKGRVEHVRESVRLARDILRATRPFSEDEALLQTVCYLILHHDDTNYSFPINQGSYGVVMTPEQFAPLFDWSQLLASQSSMRDELLVILREADGLLSSGAAGFVRTKDYSHTRSLPLFADGNPLNAWMWEESVIGNTRLAAKRALIDARSREGRLTAIERYQEVESLVGELCRHENVVYEDSPSIQCLGLDVIGTARERCVLRGYDSWIQLDQAIRRAPLLGDRSLLPYMTARIESQVICIQDIAPLSKYALSGLIELHKRIHEVLFRSYGLDFLDLAGVIEFEWGDQVIRLGPPIVERYIERQGNMVGDTWALVDGLHRCLAAQQIGLSHLRVAVLSDVPASYPLVPLPLSWNEVNIVGEVPSLGEKRRFRFSNRGDLRVLFDSYPDVYSNSPRPRTDEEAKYYTYRDYSELGSSGIRRSRQDGASLPNTG
jgi:hypothetical protein